MWLDRFPEQCDGFPQFVRVDGEAFGEPATTPQKIERFKVRCESAGESGSVRGQRRAFPYQRGAAHKHDDLCPRSQEPSHPRGGAGVPDFEDAAITPVHDVGHPVAHAHEAALDTPGQSPTWRRRASSSSISRQLPLSS